MSKITVNTDACNGCASCVESCPQHLLIQEGKKTSPRIVKEEKCISCGHCVAVCSKGAMVHCDFPESRLTEFDAEAMPSPESVHELLSSRRSVRRFRKKPIDRAALEKIVDAVRFSPSSHNVESTELVVVTDDDVRTRITELTAELLQKTKKQLSNPVIRSILLAVAADEIKSALPLLPEFEKCAYDFSRGVDHILYDAPVVMVFHGQRSASYALVNANLAAQNAALTAHALGLGAFYAGFLVGVCNRDKTIQRELNIPEENKIFAALAIGRPKWKYRRRIERTPTKTTWI